MILCIPFITLHLSSHHLVIKFSCLYFLHLRKHRHPLTHTHACTYTKQKPLIWWNKCFLCKCMNNFTSHIAFVGEWCSLRKGICIKCASECSGRKAKCNLPPSSSDFWLSPLPLTFFCCFLTPSSQFLFEHFDREMLCKTRYANANFSLSQQQHQQSNSKLKGCPCCCPLPQTSAAIKEPFRDAYYCFH